jgi:hypothetical protein
MKRFLIFLIALIFAMPLWAQVKHIVINMDGVLVKQIPARNYQAFAKKDQMISTSVNGRTAYYYVYPHAVSYLLFLQNNPQFIGHFVTHHDKNWVEAILKGLKFSAKGESIWDFIDGSLSELHTDINIQNAKFDLRKISSDLKNVLLITSIPDFAIDEQKNSEFFIGKDYYYFEKWEEAQAEIDKNNAAVLPHLPKTENEWFIEQNKISYLYQILTDAEATATTDLSASIKNLKIDQEAMTKRGLTVAKYNFQKEVTLYKFDKNKSKVLGCGIFNNLKQVFMKDLGIEECFKVHKVQFSFKYDDDFNAIACKMLDDSTGAFITETPNLGKCIEAHQSKMAYHWEGSSKKTCELYLDDKSIQKVTNNNCIDSHQICTLLPAKRCEVIEYFDGMEKMNPDQILAIGWLMKPSFSLFDKNPQPIVHDNVSLPRVSQTLYRGYNNVFYPMKNALMAMLGHPSMGLRSKRTYALEQNNLRQGLSEKEALKAAVKQTDTEFTPTKIDALINQKSGSYEQFPEHVMYFSAYMPVSFTYSKNVILIESDKSNALDLNYYSFTKGYDWRNGCGAGVDAGEVLVPNYVPSSEIMGILGGTGSTTSRLSISTAYFKVKGRGQSFIMHLDPQGSECIMRDSISQEIKFCQQNFLYKEMWPKLPTMTANRVPVCGVYMICDDRSPFNCGVTDEFRARYDFKDCGPSSPVDPNSLEWNGKQVQYFSGKELL